MDLIWSWAALVTSVLLIGGYELRLWATERSNPRSTARSAHAALREEWVRALSGQGGSEIVAVQTLRNSLMSATISASTAALALVGTLSLTVSSASQGLGLFGLTRLSPGLVIELMLLGTLFASYVCSATAMRYFSHAGFVMSLPVASPERDRLRAARGLAVRLGIARVLPCGTAHRRPDPCVGDPVGEPRSGAGVARARPAAAVVPAKAPAIAPAATRNLPCTSY